LEDITDNESFQPRRPGGIPGVSAFLRQRSFGEAGGEEESKLFFTGNFIFSVDKSPGKRYIII
jgi:hypothetical protein